MSVTGLDVGDALKALADTNVANLGQTYAFPQWAGDWDAQMDLFKVTIGGLPQWRGWVFSMGRRDVIRAEYDEFGHVRRTYTASASGILGLSNADATWRTLWTLSEALMDLFDAQHTLGGVTGGVVGGVGPCSMPAFEERMFGPVLCNYAELLIPVEVVHAAP